MCNSYPQEGPTSSPSNYRPISVLPTLSTTFERVLLPQLRKRLLQYIPDEQFGFMPNTDTADVGVVIADEVATALEANFLLTFKRIQKSSISHT